MRSHQASGCEVSERTTISGFAPGLRLGRGFIGRVVADVWAEAEADGEMTMSTSEPEWASVSEPESEPESELSDDEDELPSLSDDESSIRVSPCSRSMSTSAIGIPGGSDP